MDEYQKFIGFLTPHDINISRETFDKICQYKDILLKWNKKINLIAASTENDALFRHFLDSLQLIKYSDNMP